eukprot:TRINITY_DN122532_c0_g1_i1.p1 TRINITY_DN122532_c0_g1~~TRINITY_DN122532_c0_g1_i1.p1  ORF type:complete len:670 (+),score=126.34 TRINITY_DN122532_c0_g1_i1:80-2089(+)
MGCQAAKARLPGASVTDQKLLGTFDTRCRYSYRPVEEDFALERHVLGEGMNGVVTTVVNKASGQKCAMKVLHKKGLSSVKLGHLRQEVNNYLRIDHPHIGRLLHVYEDGDRVCLVMELYAGKEVFQRLTERKQFTEREAMNTTYQMLLAVAYLHRHNMVHCDLKLENFLFDSPNDTASVKLIDFGLTKKWDKQGHLQETLGTLSYSAPEVLKGKYTDKCDMWSLGVVVFMMLGGHAPFPMRDDESCKRAIMAGSYSFSDKRFTHVSDEAQDFVSKLLVVEPEARLSAKECFDHPWILKADIFPVEAHALQRTRSQLSKSTTDTDLTYSQRVTSQPYSPAEVLDDIRKYSQSSRLRRAALAMLAHHLTSVDLDSIKHTFLSWDTDRSGTITRENWRDAMGADLDLGEDELEFLFDQMDYSQDGEIEYCEFLAAIMLSRISLSERHLRETFDLFDVSRTGYVTASDLKRVFGGSQFEELDISECLTESIGATSAKRGISFDQFVSILRDDGGQQTFPKHGSMGPRRKPKRGSLLRTLASSLTPRSGGQEKVVRREIQEVSRRLSGNKLNGVLQEASQQSSQAGGSSSSGSTLCASCPTSCKSPPCPPSRNVSDKGAKRPHCSSRSMLACCLPICCLRQLGAGAQDRLNHDGLLGRSGAGRPARQALKGDWL